MLHLFDLTESHSQSLRIPSSASSSTSMCVSVYFKGPNGLTMRKNTFSVRGLSDELFNFRVTEIEAWSKLRIAQKLLMYL